MIYGIYQSAVERREVMLPVGKDSSFYTQDGVLKAAPRFYEKSASVDNIDGEITLGRN